MPYLLFLKKQRNLKLSSAANYRCRYKGYELYETKFIGIDIKLQVLFLFIRFPSIFSRDIRKESVDQ